MIYTIGIPMPGNPRPAQIIGLCASFVVDGRTPLPPDGPDVDGFNPDKAMQASLDNAARQCSAQFTSAGGALTGLVLPVLGAYRAGLPWSVWWWLCWLVLGVMAVLALGAPVWLGISQLTGNLGVTVPAVLMPAPSAVLILGLVVVFQVLVSLPWQVVPSPRTWFRAHRQALTPQSRMRVSARPIGGAFSGPSAGLAFLCAIARVMYSSGCALRFPWARRLATTGDCWVMSANLAVDGTFVALGRLVIALKIQAIVAHNVTHPESRLRLAVFARGDFSDVDSALGGLETLPDSAGVKRGKSAKHGLEVVFPRSLADFLRFLHPWAPTWILIRLLVLVVAVLLVGAASTGQPVAPEFIVSCTPLATPVLPGISRVELADGAVAQCDISIQSRGFPGPIDVQVVSNAEGTLGGPGSELTRSAVARLNQDRTDFRFTMPPQSSGDIAVGISVTNSALRPRQFSVFFSPPR